MNMRMLTITTQARNEMNAANGAVEEGVARRRHNRTANNSEQSDDQAEPTDDRWQNVASDDETREGADEDRSAESVATRDVRAEDVEVADLRALEGLRPDDRYDGEVDGTDRRHRCREDRTRVAP